MGDEGDVGDVGDAGVGGVSGVLRPGLDVRKTPTQIGLLKNGLLNESGYYSSSSMTGLVMWEDFQPNCCTINISIFNFEILKNLRNFANTHVKAMLKGVKFG